MKTDVNLNDFRDAFKRFDRDNFSYEGLGALYDYLIETELEMETELELDVVALCCDFSEYENIEEFQADYSGTADYLTMEDVEAATTVIPFGDKCFIIQQF